MSMNYLITGGSRGIGRGLSRLLLQRGHRVFILDNNDSELNHINSQIPQWLSKLSSLSADTEPRYEVFKADMAKKEDIEAAADSAYKFFNGKLDVLVNNAANTGGAHGPRIDTDEFLSVWENSVSVNLTGSALMSRACLPMLKKQPPHRPHGGNIIMISSTRAYQSEPNSEAYASTKAGLLGLNQALACSLAEDGIKVNAILPGWINVTHESKEGDENGMKWEDGLSEDDQKWHFSGRVGKVDDILRAVEYFSDSDSFITGEELKVDGGVTRRMTYPE
ncbi:short chain alcohol dehydrogenase [Seiridium cupressi]